MLAFETPSQSQVCCVSFMFDVILECPTNQLITGLQAFPMMSVCLGKVPVWWCKGTHGLDNCQLHHTPALSAAFMSHMHLCTFRNGLSLGTQALPLGDQ